MQRSSKRRGTTFGSSRALILQAPQCGLKKARFENRVSLYSTSHLKGYFGMGGGGGGGCQLSTEALQTYKNMNKHVYLFVLFLFKRTSPFFVLCLID